MNTVSTINSESIDPSALRDIISGGAKSSAEKIDQAGMQFEAIFVRQFLNDALKPMVKGAADGDDDAASSTYRYMITDRLSQSLASQGVFGLGQKISGQLKQRQSVDSVSTSHAVICQTGTTAANITKKSTPSST
jgi:Rod binding domain-containing protein